MNPNPVERQRKYYATSADKYDDAHLVESEHEYALSQLCGIINYYKFSSVLDVGAGTGRVLRHAKKMCSSANFIGLEPVAEMRQVGYDSGLGHEELLDGDAIKLPYPDNSWDIVCAFGILHHIPVPALAIKEMVRVAKCGIFFSDLNNYGCGSVPQRILTQSLSVVGLWKPFQWLKNGGKFEKFSEGDGIHYSYSIFDDLKLIRKKFPQTHLTNTKGANSSLYHGCSHVSVFATTSSEDLNSRLDHT